jgi:hypothetical protein
LTFGVAITRTPRPALRTGGFDSKFDNKHNWICLAQENANLLLELVEAKSLRSLESAYSLTAVALLGFLSAAMASFRSSSALFLFSTLAFGAPLLKSISRLLNLVETREFPRLGGLGATEPPRLLGRDCDYFVIMSERDRSLTSNFRLGTAGSVDDLNSAGGIDGPRDASLDSLSRVRASFKVVEEPEFVRRARLPVRDNGRGFGRSLVFDVLGATGDNCPPSFWFILLQRSGSREP